MNYVVETPNPKRWSKWAIVSLIAITSFFAITTFVCVVFENNFIYYASRFGPYDTDPGFPLEYHTLKTDDGVKLHACFSPLEGAQGTILWFHGNGGNISNCIKGIEELRRLEVSVFVVDYRGFGRSDGSPSEDGLYKDAEAAYRYLTCELKVPASKLVIFGKSLGGAPAINLASKSPCAGLIVQSAITSMRDMAPERLPYFPWVWPLMRTNFPNAEYIPKVRVPKIFIHSRDDESVPFWMGEKLFEAALEPKEFLQVSGFSHNDTRLAATPEYQNGLREFLNRILPR